LDDRHSHLRIKKINARLPDCGGVGLHRWASAKYERAMTMAILVQETALAWALAEAVKPHLSAIERNHVFMAIGAGETFAAIRGLVRSIAVKRIALRPDLVQQCITWLHAYVGHKDERYLGRLVEGYLVPCSIRIPTTVRVDRLPTTTKLRQLVALTSP
jgi:hypothetical protein